MYFLYNQTSGQILASNTQGFTPGTGEAVLGPLGSADTTTVVAYQYPQRFLVQGSPAALVEQSFWTLATSTSSGTTTITATLNNPPSTPPTSASLAVAGGAMTASVSSNQATFTVAVHPSVAAYQITATVSASGTVSGSVNLGGSQTGLPLQLITPSTPVMIAPMGTAGKIRVIEHHLQLTHDADLWYTVLGALQAQLPSAIQTALAAIKQDIQTLGL